MRLTIAPMLPLALALATATPSAASVPNESWVAVSTTAMSITGNVRKQPTRLVFANGAALAIQAIRREAITDDIGTVAPAVLYRVVNPANPSLLRGNRLCAAPVTYVAIWPTKPDAPGQTDGRGMAAYSGRRPPAANTATSCGIYRYELRAPAR